MEPAGADGASRGNAVFLVVPYRVRFAPDGVLSWVRGALPVFWHHWSEHTDIRRMSLHRRWSIFWEWRVMRPSTLSLPLESTAVDWWLSRLFRSGHWSWDEVFATQVAGSTTAAHGLFEDDALREGVREFFLPQAWIRFLHEEQSEWNERYVFLPPVTAMHARATVFDTPRAARLWLSEDPLNTLDVSFRAVRLHAFRFGDGALSIEVTLGETAADERARNLLRQLCQRLEKVRVHFAESAAFVPWHQEAEVGLASLIENFLTPSSRYEPGVPDRQQWLFTWGERLPPSDRMHRIEIPFGRRAGALLLCPGASGGCLPTTPVTPTEWGSLFVVEDFDEGHREADSRRSRMLALFVLAMFRRRKFDEVADLVASGGHDKLGSAQYLEYLRFHLSLAEDRFLHDAPVPGLAGRARWERWAELLELEPRRARVLPAVKALREDYFRGRSLRLIARVTSTFWFLFRWILVPIVLVKVVLLVGAAILVSVAGLLTLSLFATAAVLLARWLHGRLKTRTVVEGGAVRRRDWVFWGSGVLVVPVDRPAGAVRRRNWVLWAGLVEVVAIAAAAFLWPELRHQLLPMIGVFAGLLAAVGLFGIALLHHRLRRDTFARFYEQETVPIVALLIVGLIALAALVILGTIVHDLGWDSFVFRPAFWGDSVPG